MELTKQESQFIMNLLLAHLGTIGFLRGFFAEPTQDETDEREFINKLIKKVKGLTV